MDGVRPRLGHSLQFQLAAALSALVLGLALVAGAFSFWSSFEEANELQDDQLRQIAAFIDHQALPFKAWHPDLLEHSGESDLQIFVQVVGAPSAQTVSSDLGPAFALPDRLIEGLQTITMGHEEWRLHVRSMHTGETVAIGQRTAARDEIARTGALRTVLPLLALAPILLVLMLVVVRRSILPIRGLSQELDRREEGDLSRLQDERVPNEIRPFTASINRLLGRVSQSMEAQRRFVADAAHELRTPLTVLSLQAEALASQELPTQARDRMEGLTVGIHRMRALLEQLLTLARFEAEPMQVARPPPISAMAAVRTIFEEQLPLAESKHIDLGVVSDGGDALVHVRDVELHSVLRNLIGNALQYTPPGGRVDVGLSSNWEGVTIEVADSGPGIPVQERERVFDPFYRVLGSEADGSGLGLSIVKALSIRMGITVTLGDACFDAGLGGLRALVFFPAPRPDV